MNTDNPAPPNARPNFYDRIDNLSEEMEIDRVIVGRFKSRTPRVLDQFQGMAGSSGKPLAILLGRRALEVAFGNAVTEMSQRYSLIAGDADQILARAKGAESALHDLIGVMAPGAERAEELYSPLAHLSVTEVRRTGKQAVELRRKKILSDAEVLLRCRALLQSIQRQARFISVKVMKENDGKGAVRSDERAFAIPLAEIWGFLMGTWPGTSTGNNPFLYFLQAAWGDAFPASDNLHSETAALIGALRHSVTSVRSEGQPAKPSWLDLNLLPGA